MDNERIGVRRKRLPFTQLENSIFEDQLLGKEHLLVYWTLAYHADKDGGDCWPSLATIAKESRCSRAKVIEVIKDLVTAGYITKEARHDPAGDRTSNAYVLLGKRAEGGSLRDRPPQSIPETTGSPQSDQELYPPEPDPMKEKEEHAESDSAAPRPEPAPASELSPSPTSETFPEKMAKKANKEGDSKFLASVASSLISNSETAISKAIDAKMAKGGNPLYFADELWRFKDKKEAAERETILTTCNVCGSTYQKGRAAGCNHCEEHLAHTGGGPGGDLHRVAARVPELEGART
jgi:GntR family transcriptional regulator